MQILPLLSDAGDITRALARNDRADYVYSYPPRQAYRQLDPALSLEYARESLMQSQPLNLYVHVPFCQQICAYCNLFATASGIRNDHHSQYVDLLMKEFDTLLPYLGARTLATLYIGGGTPSLLSARQLSRITNHFIGAFDTSLAQVVEVALEVAPETVSPDSLQGFRSVGINRINLGIQSFGESELRSTGRKGSPELRTEALHHAMRAGFANVCIDLIYGLPGQTASSWAKSLDSVLALRPHTVCCYPLTLRPRTGYAVRGYSQVDNAAQYSRYDEANALLAGEGYIQETHVRWAIPGQGGYVQKANHWAGQDVLGIGAGARSYLKRIDLRNGYSVLQRRKAVLRYQSQISAGRLAWTDGFLMNKDESARKSMILGLNRLDRGNFRKSFGMDPIDMFPDEVAAVTESGLVVADGNFLRLTQLGHRHRDVAVQVFFSDQVRQALTRHSYDE